MYKHSSYYNLVQQNLKNCLTCKYGYDFYIHGSNVYKMLNNKENDNNVIANNKNKNEKIEIPNFLPLSFKKFLSFYNLKNNNTNEKITNQFETYIKYGGIPEVLITIQNEHICNNIINGIYNTIIMEKILLKNKLIDVSLLQKIMKYLMNNIGKLISAKQIANYLNNNETRVTHNTVMVYLKLLEDAGLIYKILRYDILHERVLKTLDKYYILDTGIRNTIVGFKESDYSELIENIVYFELLRRGYDITIGKLRKDNSYDIDFIATKENKCGRIEKKYYQIILEFTDKQIVKRKLMALKTLDINSERTILTMKEIIDEKENKEYEKIYGKGIRCMHIIDFLLGK